MEMAPLPLITISVVSTRSFSAPLVGLSDVVDLEWLRMFNYHEHQVIISGASHPVDLDDLKAHTNYSGGYDQSHPVIENFWTVVRTQSLRL